MSAPLYQLSAEYRRLIDAEDESIDATTGEVTNDFGAALAAIQDGIEVKAENCAAVLQSLKADAAAIEEEEKRLRARRKAIEANHERLRTYVRDCMVQAGVTKLKSPRFSLTVQAGRQKVQVDDVAALPGEYLAVKVEPKKDEIAAALKAGTEVPGASLVTGEAVLVVR